MYPKEKNQTAPFPYADYMQGKTHNKPKIQLSGIDNLGFGYKFNMRKQTHFNEIQINNKFCFNMSKQVVGE